jgi:hypothetical protein
MTLVLAIIAVLYATIRLRRRASGGHRPSKTRLRQRARTCRPALGGYGRACMTPAADAYEEYSDEELWSWGFSSRADFRAAEISSFQESAHEGRSVSESEWRRYHGLPLRQPTPKTGLRVCPIIRQRSRSRRAPRRVRVSRRARPASASADPEPGPGCWVAGGGDPLRFHHDLKREAPGPLAQPGVTRFLRRPARVRGRAHHGVA